MIFCERFINRNKIFMSNYKKILTSLLGIRLTISSIYHLIVNKWIFRISQNFEYYL